MDPAILDFGTEGEWYIVWEMDGMKRRRNERSAEERVIDHIVMEHLLGRISAETALGRLA